MPRIGPHSKGDDTRTERELAGLRARDWYVRYGESFPDRFADLDERQRQLVAAVVADVDARPPSSWES